MGCMCSVPLADFERRDCSRKSIKSGRGSSNSMFRRGRSSKEDDINDGGMSMVELMKRCHAVVDESFKDSVDPVMVASIVVMESSAVSNLKTFRDDFQETAYGLGQMLGSTARFLMDAGYANRRLSKPEDLYDPSIALYFVCAYIQYLALHKTTGRSEEMIIKGYHNGSVHAEEAPSDVWDLYIKAKSQMLKLNAAMECSYSDKIIHVVQSGETLEIIGRICDVSVKAILDVNPDLKEPEEIQPGDCIEIPVKKLLPRLYAVKAGDSMPAVARSHDVSLFRLLSANVDIKDPSTVKPGWLLSIPGLKGNSDNRERTELISAGIDDEPFFHSSFPDRYSMAMEADMIGGPMVRDRIDPNPHTRAVMRRIFGSHRRPTPR